MSLDSSPKRTFPCDCDDDDDGGGPGLAELVDDCIHEVMLLMPVSQRLVWGCISHRFRDLIPRPEERLPPILPELHCPMDGANAKTAIRNRSVLHQAVMCGSVDLMEWAIRRTKDLFPLEHLNTDLFSVLLSRIPSNTYHLPIAEVLRVAARRGDYNTFRDADPENRHIFTSPVDLHLGKYVMKGTTIGHQRIRDHLHSIRYKFQGDSFIGPI